MQRIERSFQQPKTQDRTTSGQGVNNINNANENTANSSHAASQLNSDHSPNKRSLSVSNTTQLLNINCTPKRHLVININSGRENVATALPTVPQHSAETDTKSGSAQNESLDKRYILFS